MKTKTRPAPRPAPPAQPSESALWYRQARHELWLARDMLERLQEPDAELRLEFGAQLVAYLALAVDSRRRARELRGS